MENNIPLRDHLEQVGNTTGKFDKRLSQEVPPLYLYIWNIFVDFHNARQDTAPIAFSEIKAWCDLMNISLSTCEVMIIKKLDSICLKHLIKRIK